ncbi:hypothetical protein [Chryseobacterium sp. ON_d1]|uniref:hypothetical protein n=1 Tax=Chryseobacterium sp. ON_d1 TaxID=2583211 RepID=UPI00115C1F65|nr:hypothetical protein [Chryseobacterium sp. ON_d1]GEJ45998.1 hypothetical protein CRS_26060 [Chryseobacterium sp. ON_d1]
MKQLELELKKRLLIVEAEEANEFIMSKGMKSGTYIVFCKGSELSHEIAKGFLHESIHTGLFAHYVIGIPVNTYCYKSALESFISAIESKGYYWGRSPIAEPNAPPFINPNSNGYSENDYVDYRYDLHQFYEAKSRTFNPEKTLIFEIL